MARTFSEQLREMTVVVADTGDIASIRRFKPQDATTNPSLIAAAATMPEYQGLVDTALSWAREQAGRGANASSVVGRAIDRLAVEFGIEILKIIPGRVSTEVDARLSYDTEATVRKAELLIEQYQAAGLPKSRVLIKIASTWEGIRAAERLEKAGIHCNLTLLFGLHQAIACADAGATLISPFVGRILDWHKKNSGRDSYPAVEDPGVISVTRIYNYLKKFGYRTEVMGASFRTLGEICELSGCDLLTIAPNFLAELERTQGELPRKLDAGSARGLALERISVDQPRFREMHAADRMATDKLSEGIEGFSKAIVSLEKQLGQRLETLG